MKEYKSENFVDYEYEEDRAYACDYCCEREAVVSGTCFECGKKEAKLMSFLISNGYTNEFVKTFVQRNLEED